MIGWSIKGAANLEIGMGTADLDCFDWNGAMLGVSRKAVFAFVAASLSRFGPVMLFISTVEASKIWDKTAIFQLQSYSWQVL